MGYLTNNYPPCGDFADSCSHEWIQPAHGEGYYAGCECILIEAFGGRQGYTAIVADNHSKIAINRFARSAKESGFVKIKLTGCGYGDEVEPTTDLDRLIRRIAHYEGLEYVK